MFQNYSNPNSKLDRQTKPRIIAIFLFIFGVVFTALVYYPISLVFKGEWKLNQKIDIVDNFFIDFQAMNLVGITRALNLEDQIPVGTISVRFYAIAILLGVLAGYFLTLYLARSQYIAGTIIDRLIIGLIIFGLVGARLFYVAFNWSDFSDKPETILTGFLSGGLAFFGMFLVCIGYLWFYCYRFKFNFYEFADLLTPGLLIGQVIGRWGNFFNYEAYGPETSVFWKMYVPATANYYSDLYASYFHPTFLYEIIPAFLLLLIILWDYHRLTEKHSGLVFATYAIGYGIIRTVVENFRLDALRTPIPQFLQPNIGGVWKIEYLYISQIVAVLLLIAGIYLWVKRSKVLYIKKSMSEFQIN